MANENDVPLNIVADTDPASKAIDAFSKELTRVFSNVNKAIEEKLGDPLKKVEENTKKSSSSIQSFFTGIKVAAAGAFAVLAGREIVGFFSDAIKEAADAQASVSSLNFALAVTGEYSEEASKQLQDFAESIQKTTTFTDDAAISSLILAKNFGLTNDAAKDLVTSAKGVAARLKVDLPQATEILLQSLNGNVRGLKELGPEFAKMSTEAATAGAAVKLSGERFKGAAEALTNTFSGAVTQASNQISDLKKTIGFFIIDQPTFVAGIKGFSKALDDLTESIKKNPELFAASLKSILDFAVIIGGTAVELVGRFVIGMNNLKVIIKDAGDIFAGSFKVIVGKLEEFTGAIIRCNPFLDALGKSIQTAGKLLGIDGAKQFDQGAKSTSAYAQESIKAAEGARLLTKGATEAISALSKGGPVTNNSAEALKKLNEQSKAAGSGYGKLREEAIKFFDELHKSSLSDFKKAELSRQDDLEKIRKYVKENSALREKGIAATADVETRFQKTIGDLRNKANDQLRADFKKLKDDREKDAQDARKKIESIISDPFAFTISSIKLDDGALRDLNNQIALSLGAIKSVLGGKEGAKELVATAAGAIGDAVLPGIGPLVKDITKTLALGPEAVKQLVREFTDELPRIFDSIGEAAPAFVEAFVDSMVTKGGALKVGIAIARAMSGEASLRSLGKQIGSEASKEFLSAMKRGINDFGNNISVGLKNFFDGIIPQLSTAIGASLVGAFGSLGAVLGGSDLPGRIREAILSAGSYFVTDFYNAVANLPNSAANRLKDAFFEPVNALKDFLNQFKFPGIPGIGGGGGGGGVLGTVVGAVTGGRVHLATGGLVPKGYPNDSFPASLSSGELIVPTDLVGSLAAFLQGSGSSGGGDISTALLAQIASLLKQPMTVETTANISGKAFADIILNLSRNNARTAA